MALGTRMTVTWPCNIYKEALICRSLHSSDVRPGVFNSPVCLDVEVPKDLSLDILKDPLWFMVVPLVTDMETILLTKVPAEIHAHLVVSPFIIFMRQHFTCAYNSQLSLRKAGICQSSLGGKWYSSPSSVFNA